MIAEDVYLLSGLALLSLVVVLALYKEFRLLAFDSEFARVGGWPVFALDWLLLALVALTVVIGLPAVGVILMAALLIIPAAAARFWTDRLGILLVLAAVFGMFAGVAGTLISAAYDVATGPAIVLAAAVVFLVSLFLAPRRGVLARWLEQWRLREELKAEPEGAT
jgi:manganese/zinc/iron transport system permease protein